MDDDAPPSRSPPSTPRPTRFAIPGPIPVAIALMVALGPLVALAPRGMPVWFILMAVVAVVGSWRDGLPTLRIDWVAAAPAVALVAWALVTAFWSPSARAWATTAEIAYACVGALVIAAWFRDLDEVVRRRLRLAAAVGVALGIALFAEEVWRDYPIHRWWHDVPADDALFNTNVPKRSGALLVAMSWSLAAFAVSHRADWRGWRWASPIIPVTITAMSLFAPSRSAALGMFLGMIVFLMARADGKRAETVRRWLLGAAVAATALMVPLAWPFAWLASLGPTEGFFRSALHRFEIWGHAVGRIVEAPLLGHGIDAARALPVAGETSRFAELGPTIMPLHPHNAFLQVWLELGGVGAALIILLALVVLARRRMGTATGDPVAAALTLGMYASMLTMVGEAYGVWQAWWMCGLITAGLLMALQCPAERQPVGRGGIPVTPPPRRILIIKLGALGDFFLAQTAFAALRAHHRDDHLTLLTIPALAPLARMSGLFDAVWEDSRGRRPSDWLAMRRLLRGGRFDRVYDLQGQSRTDRYHLLFAPGPWPEWSGPARFASHSDRYPGRRRVPVLERYARQLAPFGIGIPATADLSWLDADTSALAPSGPYALLIPGASPGRPDKRWPEARYGELAARLSAKGVTPVVVGTEVERPLAAAIREVAPGAVDLTGRTTIPQLAGLARRARVVVGNDTGPTHLAASVGAPTLALFSDASNPIHIGGPNAVIHHHPRFEDMDADGVMAAIGRLTA